MTLERSMTIEEAIQAAVDNPDIDLHVLEDLAPGDKPSHVVVVVQGEQRCRDMLLAISLVDDICELRRQGTGDLSENEAYRWIRASSRKHPSTGHLVLVKWYRDSLPSFAVYLGSTGWLRLEGGMYMPVTDRPFAYASIRRLSAWARN